MEVASTAFYTVFPFPELHSFQASLPKSPQISCSTAGNLYNQKGLVQIFFFKKMTFLAVIMCLGGHELDLAQQPSDQFGSLGYCVLQACFLMTLK